MFCVIIDVIAFDHIGGIPLQLQHSQGANLGQDKISRLLFQLALPAILAQLINLLYNMVTGCTSATFPMSAPTR